MHHYHVYILGSESGTLYIGVTNNLLRRIQEHKEKGINGFTKKYECSKLVYFEETGDIHIAIEREKQLKRWRREKKVYLIELMNPGWRDLYLDLF